MQPLWFSIRRFWDGNEIWLLVVGGVILFFAPSLAAGLLLLAMLRTAGQELQKRTRSPLWRRALGSWSGISSLLLMVGLGAAAGCVIRGTPPTGESRILSWFPALCAVCALAVLTLQSVAWTAVSSDGAMRIRARRLTAGLWWAVVTGYAAMMSVWFASQPRAIDSFQPGSWNFACAIVTLAGLMAVRMCLSVGFDLGTFSAAASMTAGTVVWIAGRLADVHWTVDTAWGEFALFFGLIGLIALRGRLPLVRAQQPYGHAAR